MESIDLEIRGMILKDLLNELFPIFYAGYYDRMQYARIDRYLTTGLNLCNNVNELLIIIPDYLISSIKSLSFKNLRLPKEIPERFIIFLNQNQDTIELIAYIHMQNILSK